MKMRLPKIKMPAKVSKFARATGKTLRKHAPEIITTAGTVLIIAGTVKACKDTMELDDSGLIENIEDIQEIKEARATVDEVKYTPAMYRKDLFGAYMRTTGTVVKQYWRSAVMIGAGLALKDKAMIIFKRREGKALAAMAGIKSAFDGYRTNVKKKYGEEVDKEMLYGIEKKKIEVTEVDPETGETKKVKKNVEVSTGLNSPYARYFSQSKYYQEDENGRPWTYYNESRIRGALIEAQAMCMRDKYIWHDDELRLLGLESTSTIADKHVGVIYEDSDPERIGNCAWTVRKVYVEDDRFIEGVREDFIIDFEVDGKFEEKLQEMKLIDRI